MRKVVEKIKTLILCFKNFFRKSYLLWDNLEKYGRAGQATNDNIKRRMRFLARKLRQKYRPTLKIFPLYLLSTATIVTRTSLSVTLYVSFLFCRL